jgi:hypothetical protein
MNKIKDIYAAYTLNSDKISGFKIVSEIIINNEDIFGLLWLLSHKDNEFLESYAEYVSTTGKSLDILKILLSITRRSKKKYEITEKIWSCKGFRNIITTYPKSSDGYMAIKDSIFSSLTEKDSLILNITDAYNSLKPLIEDSDIHDFLINYIDMIIRYNIGYTYINPEMVDRKKISTIDFLVLIFNVMISIFKKKEKYDLNVFWNAINIIYVTMYDMYDKMIMSISDNQDALKSNDNEVDKERIKNALKINMNDVDVICQYMKTIDIEYVDNMIIKYSPYLIENKEYDILSRVIMSFGIRPSVSFKVSRLNICEFILLILDSETPLHIKFNAFRVIISHNLKGQIFECTNSRHIISQYILKDVTRIKELDKIHLIDIMIDLSESQIMESPDVLELYMFLLSGFSEQYTKILKIFLKISDKNKIMAMEDCMHIVEMSALLIRNLPILGRYALSYLPDILIFVETICDTKFTMIQSLDHRDYSEEMTKHMMIFDTMREKYIEKIKPFIISMLKVLDANFKIIIDSNTNAILNNIIDIDFDIDNDLTKDFKNIKIINEIPENISDVITYGIAINPYFLKSADKPQLIDRKTLFSIYQTQTNPFTRQHIDKIEIDQYNDTPEIKKLRQDVTDIIMSL